MFRVLISMVCNWCTNVIKNFFFSLCVTDIFSKHAWVILLKDKKDISITNDFLKNLIANQTKYVLIKAVNFTIGQWNHFWRIIIKKCIQQIMKENPFLLKGLLEP